MPTTLTVLRFRQPMAWGALDLPLFGLTGAWYGNAVDPLAGWSLAVDPERLWFVASRSRPALAHPQARPGKFLAGLWRHDVAELFISAPSGEPYLELNLAPNGAWWSALFATPRERVEPVDREWPEVRTHAESAADGSWVAAISLPLESLRAVLDFGERSRANVTFILDSPDQRFLSAAAPGDGDPDFHRPSAFLPLGFHDGGLPGGGPPH